MASEGLRTVRKRYMGFSRSEDGSGGAVVQVIDERGARALNPRHDLINHSPDGFNWGYGGSGPTQLALALLADALGDDNRAIRLRHRFRNQVVAGWQMGAPWDISADEVNRIADNLDNLEDDR